MIPNIVKGRGITGALKYALGEGYTGQKDTAFNMAMARAAGIDIKGAKKTADNDNSRATILGGQNFGFEIDSLERVERARKSMEWNGLEMNQASKGRKCENDCLHAQLAWEKGQNPRPAEMRAAAEEFLAALGMKDAMAVFIAHADKKHKHVHIIASRLDPLTGKTYSQVDDFTKGQAWALRYEKVHGLPQNEDRRALHALVDAAEAKNEFAVAEHLTERSPTFTARELDKALSLARLEPAEREKFRASVLNSAEVVALRESADAEVSRYTTRRQLKEELEILTTADSLAGKTGFGVRKAVADKAAKDFTLIEEQAEALHKLTDRKALGILWGEAGTGKSHTLKSVRSVYEQEGFRVIGTSHTNKVVQAMRRDGFSTVNTVMGELSAIDKKRTKWDNKTVIVVDEAAMLSNDMIGRILKAADAAGAKVILAGDDAQLGAVRAKGGLFETLREKHGAAILTVVQRVRTPEEQAAFNQMHKGEFRKPLALIHQKGNLHWADTQDNALRATAEAYTADTAAAPGKRRIIIAATNAEVDALNEYARDLHKKRGDLGEDHIVRTATGELALAVGDRIQFTGNGYGKQAKNSGLVTSALATVQGVEEVNSRARLTVAIDGFDKPVTFDVGGNGKAGQFDQIKRGYAGTTHKAQGDTLDQTYVTFSAAWRWSGSYVNLTRARDRVKIFASYDTLRRMDRKRDIFARGKEPTPADISKAIDLMAASMERQDGKRAATAYYIDRVLNLGDNLRNVGDIAQRDGKPYRAYEAVAVSLEAERQARQRRSALQALAGLFGRDIAQDQARDRTRGRGGGQSL